MACHADTGDMVPTRKMGQLNSAMPAGRPFVRIVHLSDLHFGATDPRLEQGLCDDLAALAASGAVDALVISGDLTQRARPGQFAVAAGYVQKISQLLGSHTASGSHTPLLLTPGNHDVPLWNLVARSLHPLNNFRRGTTGLGVDALAVGNVAIATANSARRCSLRPRGFWKDGLLNRQRLAGAAAALRAANTRWRVLVTHHPAAVAGGLSKAEIVHGWQNVARQIENAGVNVILGGHLHEPYVTQISLPAGGKATYIAAGTAISTRRRHAPNTYNVLEFGDELRVERRDWTGQGFVPVG